MKNKHTFIHFLLISMISVSLFISCKPDLKKEKTARINELETMLFEQKQGVIDKKEAANMIQAYLDYVDTYPADTISAQYLFKAADVSINSFHSMESIELFDRLINEYPNFSKAPQALFLKAFTFENYLLQLDSARVNYELFLQKYPNHPFANDAEITLKNLGKTPEEIIQEFKAQ